MIRSTSISCLDCEWSIPDTKPNFRPVAMIHAKRMQHRVQLITIKTVIYSDKTFLEGIEK
jgi:hypothetical protein